MSHEIRLAGPWEYECDANAAAQRCSLPLRLSDLKLAADCQQVLLRRRFHKPTGLDEVATVRVVIASVGVADIRLNEVSVQPGGATVISGDVTTSIAAGDLSSVLREYEITSLLRPFNILEVCFAVRGGDRADQVLESVRLRIDEGSGGPS